MATPPLSTYQGVDGRLFDFNDPDDRNALLGKPPAKPEKVVVVVVVVVVVESVQLQHGSQSER